MKETREELEELDLEDIEIETGMRDKSRKRDKKWFEKYRWFYSSDGYLVLLGRDAQTNELLVKKHMQGGDKYLHADFDGAPSVVVKKGQEAPDSTLEEAAKAAVSFTKTWKAGIGAADVYMVDPDQVTKNPESGEYLEKGSFVIRGEREYFRNISVDVSVGSYEIEDDLFVPFSGPEEAVDSSSELTVRLKPGNRKKSDLAKELQAKFRDEVDQSLDLDYLVRVLPPGKSEVEEVAK